MPSKPPQPGALYKRHQDCPDRAKHTRHPEGYIAHGEWAMQKMKTHRCQQCPTCGFWSIWVPKKSARIDGQAGDSGVNSSQNEGTT